MANETAVAIQQIHAQFDNTTLSLRSNTQDFLTSQTELNAASPDLPKGLDPRITASNVTLQKSFMRKLKFQYLEQNAKDRYVRAIVSDIDDAPIVAPEDNKALEEANKAKKAELRVCKAKLRETHDNIRTLAPLVEQDYNRVRDSIKQAEELSQKIVDAQLALTRLRQTHPHPRYTAASAEAKLQDQIDEMQRLNDTLDQTKSQVSQTKHRVATGTSEVERLRGEKASLKDELQIHEHEGVKDDERLAPLYDWFTAAISVHCWIHNLMESYAVSENELRLTYNVGPPGGEEVQLVITLIFVPETRQLASVRCEGLQELGVSMDATIENYVEMDDVQGAVGVILSAARGAAAGVR